MVAAEERLNNVVVCDGGIASCEVDLVHYDQGRILKINDLLDIDVFVLSLDYSIFRSGYSRLLVPP